MTRSDDRFDKWFNRLVRLVMLVLGAGGFVYEVVSPDRTLWVGLLSAGLVAGQLAALVELLAAGITIGGVRRTSQSAPEHSVAPADTNQEDAAK